MDKDTRQLPDDFPPHLGNAYRLAIHDNSRFGVIFFQSTNGEFPLDASGIKPNIIGIPRDKGVAITKGMAELPPEILRSGRPFFAVVDGRTYFKVQPDPDGPIVTRDEAANLSGIEEKARIYQFQKLGREIVATQSPDLVRQMHKDSQYAYKMHIFGIREERATWLLENPDLLAEVGHMAATDLEPLPVAKVNAWPEKHVEAFFYNPAQYGCHIKSDKLSEMAIQMEAKHVPAITRAGISSPNRRDLIQKYPETATAFDVEHFRLALALGGSREADMLMDLRHSKIGKTEALEVMEERVKSYTAMREGDRLHVERNSIPRGSSFFPTGLGKTGTEKTV